MTPDNGRVNRVSKLIINPDTGKVPCCWDTCDRPARQSYIMRFHEHPLQVPCAWVDQAGGSLGRHYHYTFCSPGHGRYFALCMGWAAHETAARNHGQIFGYLQPGVRTPR
jgi:hypothetical protein